VGIAVGTITTTNQNTGLTSIAKTLIGQKTSVAANLTVSEVQSTESSPGPAVSFALTVSSSPGNAQEIMSTGSFEAGTPMGEQVTVTALDADGNVATGYAGTVSLFSSDPQAALPDSYTFDPSTDKGSHTFTVFLDTTGAQTLTAEDSNSNTLSGHATVNITPAPAASLLVSAPSSTTTGSKSAIAVTALDFYGNVATGFTGTVSLSSSNQAGSQATGVTPKVVFSDDAARAAASVLSSYTFKPADKGNHLFAVTLKTTGSQTIMASASKVSGNGEANLQVAAAPTKLVISQPMNSIAHGSPFGLTVNAVDSHGNVVTSFNGLVTLTLAANPGGGTLMLAPNSGGTLLGGNAVSVQAVDGVAAFSGLTLNKLGKGYRFKASSGSLPVATSSTFNVTAGAAAKVVLLSQPPSKVGAASPFGLKVAVEDAQGYVVTSYTGSVTLALANDPGVNLGGNLTLTVVNGVATFSGLTMTQAGSYSLIASSGSLTVATTAVFTVKAGAATQFTISTQPPSSVTAGSSFGLVVTALDLFGNVASSYSGNVTLALAINRTGLGILGGKVSVQAAGGVATFKGLTLNLAANGCTIRTKNGNLIPAVTSSIDVVS
jgi:hypothetical protein